MRDLTDPIDTSFPDTYFKSLRNIVPPIEHDKTLKALGNFDTPSQQPPANNRSGPEENTLHKGRDDTGTTDTRKLPSELKSKDAPVDFPYQENIQEGRPPSASLKGKPNLREMKGNREELPTISE